MQFLLTAIVLLSIVANVQANSFVHHSLGNDQVAFQLSVPSDFSWQSCGTDKDLLTLQDISIVPDPPQRGKPLALTIKGSLKEEIQLGARVSLFVKFGAIKLYSFDGDLCDELGKIDGAPKCPLSEGPFVVEQKFDLPQNVPSGRYTLHVEAKSNAGSQIICLNGQMKI